MFGNGKYYKDNYYIDVKSKINKYRTKIFSLGNSIPSENFGMERENSEFHLHRWNFLSNEISLNILKGSSNHSRTVHSKPDIKADVMTNP